MPEAKVTGNDSRGAWRGAPRGGRAPVVLVGLVVLLAGIAVLSLVVGAKSIAPGEVWRVLLHRDGSDDAFVIWDRRVPRTLLGVAAGAALGLAGALMQALSRNPLADPGLLGVNSGAAAAVVTTGTLLPSAGGVVNIMFAFAGAGLATTVVYALGRGGGRRATPVRLVLAGMATSAVLVSFTAALTLLDDDSANSLRFWLVGSLAAAKADEVALVTPFIVVAAVAGVALSARLNALALGDEAGRALGVHPGRVRAVTLVVVTILCGAATAAIGPITFVGLMVPHAVRILTGPDLRWLLPFSMLLAPVVLLASDVLGRVVARPGELEAGVVTAFVGAPLFIMLVRRRKVAEL
ncbi:iron complex transport system permease protein [Actinomadura pelletieri DSM 43383]|uniref:Iron complex transport system permease protein n=1 Tax=Actinomadura pelletieri DSM 43383 TaxID=1120940 RepID=A0A495QU63_9ACTN|nr:iron complex transport system permease protein [Actinomadura pelletieri DSM 43383]